MEKLPTQSTAKNTGEQFFGKTTADELIGASSPHQRSLLRIIALCEKHNVPIGQAIDCFADEQTSRYHATVVHKLVDHLESGGQVLDGICTIPGLATPECILAIQLAEQNKSQPVLFTELLQDIDEYQQDPDIADRNYAPKYFRLLAKVMLICAILTFMYIMVIPTFKDIFEEFGIELPAIFDLFTTMLDYLLVFALPVMVVCYIILIFPLGYGPFRRYLRRWNPGEWQQPFLPSNVSRRRSLALIAQSGMSIEEGLRFIAENPKLRKVFRKLDSIRSKLSQYSNPWECLAAYHVISKQEARGIAATQSRETQAWLLRHSAIGLHEVATRRAGFVAQLITALANSFLAILVLMAAAAVFMTLVSIMESFTY